MGYLVYRSTKAEAVRRELADLKGHSILLASRLIGPRLWYLAERNGTRWIGLTLIKTQGEEVAVKHMDESVAPYYYDCPLSYLSRASPEPGRYAALWRKEVQAFHARRAADKATRSTACSGQRVRLGLEAYVLQRSLGRKGWEVRRERDGQLMRMLARQFRQAEWLASAPEPSSVEQADTSLTAGPPRPNHALA